MTVEFDLLLPELSEFEMDNVPYKVVDPAELPERTRAAFDAFMRGSAAPHPIYVYCHDYSRFCMHIRQGRLKQTKK